MGDVLFLDLGHVLLGAVFQCKACDRYFNLAVLLMAINFFFLKFLCTGHLFLLVLFNKAGSAAL